MIYGKECIHCNGIIAPFKPSDKRKFCSRRCNDNYRKGKSVTSIDDKMKYRKILFCANCGEKCIKRIKKGKNQKFCSSNCSKEYRYRNRIVTKFTCISCLKINSVTTNTRNVKNPKYCSRECWNNRPFSPRIRNTEYINDRKCAFCNNFIKSFAKLRNKIFCNVSCYRQYNRQELNTSYDSCAYCGINIINNAKKLSLRIKLMYCSNSCRIKSKQLDKCYICGGILDSFKRGNVCHLCTNAASSVRSLFREKKIIISLPIKKTKDLILTYRIFKEKTKEIKNESFHYSERN